MDLRRRVTDICAGARGLTDHTAIYDLEPDHRPDAPRVRRIKAPHRHFPFFFELARHPNLLELLHALLGTRDVRLHGSKINLKAPAGGAPVEWHQDWAFYPHTNDDLLAVGIMLEDCTVENGAMLMLPGTHRGVVLDHHAGGEFCGAIDLATADLDFGRAVPCIGSAGSISFHHVRTVHGSAENTSAHPRTLLLYEFAAADAWPLQGCGDWAEFEGRMVSGVSTITPRLASVPVRMPLPPASRGGSIYENQMNARSRYFGRSEPVSAAPR